MIPGAAELNEEIYRTLDEEASPITTMERKSHFFFPSFAGFPHVERLGREASAPGGARGTRSGTSPILLPYKSGPFTKRKHAKIALELKGPLLYPRTCTSPPLRMTRSILREVQLPGYSAAFVRAAGRSGLRERVLAGRPERSTGRGGKRERPQARQSGVCVTARSLPIVAA